MIQRNESEFRERQARENKRHYEKWLSCGYKGDMVLNDVGWCDNKLDKTQLRKLTVIKSKQVDAEVEYVQLPNGTGSQVLTCPPKFPPTTVTVVARVYGANSTKQRAKP